MVQPLVNVFIGTVIGSSLCAAIAVVEITYVTQQLNIQSAEAVLLFLVAGAVYLVLSLGGAAIGRQIEKAVAPGAQRRARLQVGTEAPA
jgi:glutamate transport system permease protein